MYGRRAAKERPFKMKKPEDNNLKLVVDNSDAKTSHWSDPLALNTGGSSGGDDWLSRLPVGTIFACIDKGSNAALCMVWEILFKGDKVARLITDLPGHPPELMVLTKAFSQRTELVEVLTQVKEQ